MFNKRNLAVAVASALTAASFMNSAQVAFAQAPAVSTTTVAAPAAKAPPVAAPTPAKPAASASGSSVATIGSLTVLARQVREATLKKELRELTNASAGNAARNVNAGAGPALSDPVTLTPVARPARTKPATPAAPVVREPRVTSVSGVGKRLVATLDNGEQLAVGDKLSAAGISWTAQAITKEGVKFQRCDSTNKCSTANIDVGRVL